ncbi:hypothetical protein DENSPDRAFT_108038 [Dentipellis sp. KUC8613]|nr:hypothetical protein DENSPDRAFT_108038 [Dentipellis sp. KUC8613]
MVSPRPTRNSLISPNDPDARERKSTPVHTANPPQIPTTKHRTQNKTKRKHAITYRNRATPSSTIPYTQNETPNALFRFQFQPRPPAVPKPRHRHREYG